MDVFEEDEEYLISLPDDEESEVEESEDADEVDDETSDDAKEFEKEFEETATEKALPVIDNPIPRNEGPTCYFNLKGTSGEFSVTSDQSQNGSVPTLYVLQNANCTITAYGEFTSGNPQWLIKRANSTLVSLSNQTGALTYNFIANSNGSYGRTYMVLCRTTGADPQECAIRISIVDGIKVFDPKLDGFTAPQYTVNPEIQKIAIYNFQNQLVDTRSVVSGHFSWDGKWGKKINGTDTEHKGKYADPGKYSFRVVKNNNVTSEIVLSVFIVRLGVQAIKFIDSIPYQYHKTTMLNNTNYSVDTSNSSTYNWRISALDFLKPNDEARPRTEAKKARPPVGECFDDTNNSGEYEAGEDGEDGENFYDVDGNDAYSSTLRQTNFPNHISNGQQDTSNYNHPAVYVRESKIKIELTMGITAISDITGDSVPSNLVVVNDYPIHIIAKFKNKDMNYVGYSTSDNGMICSNDGKIMLEADQDSRLADTVGYSANEIITFSFAYEDVDACTEANKENYEQKQNWVSIPGTQTTQHLIYRLGGAPTPAPDSEDDIFLKIIDKSCQWANGKKIQSDIFGAIWSNLWTPINGTGEDARPDNTHGFKGTGDPIESTRQDMWGNSPKCFTYQHTADAGYYVTDMLDNNSGRCEAWARFLIAFTRIHGVKVEKVVMPPMKWMFEGADHIKHFVDYAEAERYLNDNKRYDGTSAIIGDKWYKPFGIWVDPDGQANPSFHNPPAVDNSTMVSPHLRALFGCIKRPDIIFTDHVFVKYDNKYYDPSYRHIYNIGFDTINALCDTSVTYFIYGEMYEYSYIFPLLPILGEGFSQQSNPKVLYHGGGNRTGTEINYYNIKYYKEQANDSFTAEMEEL